MLITFDKKAEKKKSDVSYNASPISPGENEKVKPILTPFDNDFSKYESTASTTSVRPPTPSFKQNEFTNLDNSIRPNNLARSTLETPFYEPEPKLPKLMDPPFTMNKPDHLAEQDYHIRIENDFEASNQTFGKECESYSLTVENENQLNSAKVFTLTCKLCTENHYSRKSNDRKKLMAAYRTHKYRHHSEKGRLFLEKLQAGNTNLSEIQLDPNFSSFLIGSNDKENKFFRKSEK